VDRPSSYLAIDEFGRILENEARINDQDRLQSLFENLHFSDWGALISNTNDQSYIIEAFEAPWVIIELKFENEKVIGLNTYGFSTILELNTCYFDEYDRLHGYTDKNIPWVLNRDAQEFFFDHLDEFDDNGFVYKGKRYETEQTIAPTTNQSLIVSTEAHSALKDMLPRMKLPKSRVLILGGTPADADHWRNEGHVVTTVNTTDEIFNLPRSFDKSFDFIYENGFFASVVPDRRYEIFQIWNRCLLQGGYFMGLFLITSEKQGPPFGVSEWLMRQKLQGNYHILFWGRWKNSISSLVGKELFILAQKK